MKREEEKPLVFEVNSEKKIEREIERALTSLVLNSGNVLSIKIEKKGLI